MRKQLTALAAGMALACSSAAHADSITDYIRFEAGFGFGVATDVGDGIWVQKGSPDNYEKITFPAILAGFTGPIWSHDAWDLRWHLGYTYLGEQRAHVDGVPDDQYNPNTHQIVGYDGERYSPFNGHGHLQGIPATIDIGYTWRGWRFGAEAGAWVYWQTWHESLYALDNEWHDLSHKTVAQVGYVAGASVSCGPFSLSYRYYNVSQKWNPYPGLATGAHVLMLKYRF